MNHIWLKVKQLNKISSKECLVLVMNSNHCLNMVRCACFSSKYGDIYSFFSQKKTFLQKFFLANTIWKFTKKTIFEKVGPIVENEDGKVSKWTTMLLWVGNGERWTSSREQEGIFGTYPMANHRLLLEYFHATWIQIMWCGIVFLDEFWSILSHG
jgi:hypothetical protein